MGMSASNQPDPTGDETLGEKLLAIEDAQAFLRDALTHVEDAIGALDHVGITLADLDDLSEGIVKVRQALEVRYGDLEDQL